MKVGLRWLTLALLASSPIAVRPLAAQAAAPAPAAATSERPSDVLRPGDIVRLQIWREPDLSGDFPVNPEGVVIFPRIGAYDVSSESPETLQRKLTGMYGVYLRNPSITVTPMRRVNVLGSVGKPGLYPVDATMTIADALALAGGASAIGSTDRVDLIRDGKRVAVKLDQGARIIDTPIRSGDQLFVPERNWVSRNSGVVSAAITGAISLFIALRR